MQWHTQAGSINTNLKVNIYLNLPETSATAIMTWNFHVDDLGKDRYYMILGWNILTIWGLNINTLITSLNQMIDLLKSQLHI